MLGQLWGITAHYQPAMFAGIIDDIYGASFLDGAVSGDPMDKNGHGTFVAGVVGAVGNNALVSSAALEQTYQLSIEKNGVGWP